MPNRYSTADSTVTLGQHNKGRGRERGVRRAAGWLRKASPVLTSLTPFNILSQVCVISVDTAGISAPAVSPSAMREVVRNTDSALFTPCKGYIYMLLMSTQFKASCNIST